MVNCDSSRQLCMQTEVYNTPRMYYFPAGPKEIKTKLDYRHVIESEVLGEWLLDNYAIFQVKSIVEMDSEEQYELYCK